MTRTTVKRVLRKAERIFDRVKSNKITKVSAYVIAEGGTTLAIANIIKLLLLI